MCLQISPSDFESFGINKISAFTNFKMIMDAIWDELSDSHGHIPIEKRQALFDKQFEVAWVKFVETDDNSLVNVDFDYAQTHAKVAIKCALNPVSFDIKWYPGIPSAFPKLNYQN